jgi:hypothetical protein
MQEATDTVHLADVLTRPRWLNVLEEQRNRWKWTPYCMELWAELVWTFLYIAKEIKSLMLAPSLDALSIHTWVHIGIISFFLFLTLEPGIGSAVGQFNAIASKQPSLTSK